MAGQNENTDARKFREMTLPPEVVEERRKNLAARAAAPPSEPLPPYFSGPATPEAQPAKHMNGSRRTALVVAIVGVTLGALAGLALVLTSDSTAKPAVTPMLSAAKRAEMTPAEPSSVVPSTPAAAPVAKDAPTPPTPGASASSGPSVTKAATPSNVRAGSRKSGLWLD